jgi:Fe-S oxidoreductase
VSALYHGGTAEIGDRVAPNNIGVERERLGLTPNDVAARAEVDPKTYDAIEDGRVLPTTEEYERIRAALGDIEGSRLYRISFLQLMGVDPKYSKLAPAKLIRAVGGAKELLLAKHEMTWQEKRIRPDEPVDVFLALSCGTQASPHLLLDTIAVCEALGISYVAAAGPAGCCGKPYVANRMTTVGDAWSREKSNFALESGATQIVSWCTACQQNATVMAARRSVTQGEVHPIRESQVLTFLKEKIAEMGDRVPWKGEMNRKVLAEGHARTSPVHAGALEAEVELLRLIPGVEVVGTYDGFDPESPCAYAAREESYGTWRKDETAEDIIEHRALLADMVHARGADTVACQHQGCHQAWSRYASDRLAVRHPISIVAEALGVAHPDRYQAATRIGDPKEIVEQTRPVWSTWDITEGRALELAKLIVDPRYAAGLTQHACGRDGGSCGEKLISVDILTATSRPKASN